MAKKYTRRERRLIHEALVTAKPRLRRTSNEQGKQYAICFAICPTSEVLSEGKRLARRMVMHRLQGYGTVSSWLRANVPMFHKDMTGRSIKRELNIIQEYRHLWLDALIKEFSK